MATAPRGRSFLTGARWPRAHGAALVLDRQADVAFEDIDAVWPALDDDERLLFLLGYEASLGRRGDFSPDSFAWRCHVVADADADAAADLPPSPSLTPRSLALSTTEAAHQAHLTRVRRCHELLKDGVLYQANLAHRLDVAAADHDDGLAFFAGSAARDLGCSAFVDVVGFGSLISLSPERFIEADLRAHTATTFPIKGTLPRSQDPAALLASTKDQAEHVMIVDLMRNDLSRVAEDGSVVVDTLLAVESYANVHQLVSTVSAQLRPECSAADAVEACFPAGSMTGAPKISAMRILAELEGDARGIYSGAFGFFGDDGAAELAMVIRSLVIDRTGVTIGSGGGITIDSDAEAELAEMHLKAEPLLRALGQPHTPVT